MSIVNRVEGSTHYAQSEFCHAKSFRGLVTLGAGVFVIVAVSYIAVRVSDECQKDED